MATILMRLARVTVLAALLAGLLITGLACRSRQKRPLPYPEGTEPTEIVDAGFVSEPLGPLDKSALRDAILERRVELALRRRAREEKIGRADDGKPYRQKEYSILTLSGGGVYGAYPAGLLCGWSASGKTPEEGGRPVFDVVTGVSTGALIAPLAFLGPEYDPELKQYTEVRRRDIFKIQLSVRTILSGSLTDNSPLRERIDRICTPELVAKIAAAHAEGRRLYLGTANLDTRRLVVWDIGAIATKGTEEARKLIVEVILTSAAIPGFFPPGRFWVNIDGKCYEEVHGDGAVARRMFFQPPHFAPDERQTPGRSSLIGSTVFALNAGKDYGDPLAIRSRTLAAAGAYLSNSHYSAIRGDLDRIYTYCLLCGMDFFTAAIPADLDDGESILSFDPVVTTRMFDEGYRVGKQGAFGKITKADADNAGKPFAYPDGSPIVFKEPNPSWRSTPPGFETESRGPDRAGLNLTIKKGH